MLSAARAIPHTAQRIFTIAGSLFSPLCHLLGTT
jgi:hypothetical protein